MKKKVLAIMLVAVSIMLISACGKKEKLYEIPDLSQYKTDYVGDSSNVIKDRKSTRLNSSHSV